MTKQIMTICMFHLPTRSKPGRPHNPSLVVLLTNTDVNMTKILGSRWWIALRCVRISKSKSGKSKSGTPSPSALPNILHKSSTHAHVWVLPTRLYIRQACVRTHPGWMEWLTTIPWHIGRIYYVKSRTWNSKMAHGCVCIVEPLPSDHRLNS